MTGQNACYSGVNCALGPSKSIHHSRDFVIAGFVSTYFYCFSSGPSNVVPYNGVSIIAGLVIAGWHCT